MAAQQDLQGSGGLRMARQILSFAVAMFFCAPANAVNYYVDSIAGSDAATGKSITTPWKSLKPFQKLTSVGSDTLFLKSGSVFSSVSMRINWSGTATKPFVITGYGDTTKPPILKNSATAEVLLELVGAKNIVIQRVALNGCKFGCITTDTASRNVVIQDNDLTNCGTGISVAGRNVVIRRNAIHDMHMVVNSKGTVGTAQADDDYGGTGINLGGIDGCSVIGNHLYNLITPSYDYGVDGGAIEVWGNVRHCEISRNLVVDADGFMETGGVKGDSMIGVSVHHNLVYNSGNFACFFIYDSVSRQGLIHDSLTMDHNTVVVLKRTPGFFLLQNGAKIDRSNRIKVRNNIFYADSVISFSYASANPYDSGVGYEHSYNLIWSRIAKIFGTSGPKAHTGEISSDPLFRDLANFDFALKSNSPARSKGLNLGYAADFVNSPINTTGSVDLGAFAFTASSSIPQARGASPVRAHWTRDGKIVREFSDAGRVRVEAMDANGRRSLPSLDWDVKPGVGTFSLFDQLRDAHQLRMVRLVLPSGVSEVLISPKI